MNSIRNVFNICLSIYQITASAEDKAEGLYRRMKMKELVHRVPQVIPIVYIYYYYYLYI